MKIISNTISFLKRKNYKDFIVRISIFLICFTALGLSPKNTLSQNKIVIDRDMTISVDELFTIIIKQADYNFIYEEGLFDNLPKIELKKGTIGLNTLLNKTLSEYKNLALVVTKNNSILIKKRESLQEKLIKGKVTDSNGVPLVGVTVLIKGTVKGTTTDYSGEFTIRVPDNQSVLVFSYLGFKKQETLVGEKEIISITLEEEISELKSVVINAGYYNTTERESTGSISKVEAKDIEKQPVNNFLSAIPGQVTGVIVTPNSGLNGGGYDITIRGRNSIGNSLASGLPDRPGNSQPLYIINGVPYDGSSLSSTTVNFSGTGNISPLNTLNPADIESLEILKDADATAIYGARGANGVVLITTKKGTAGKTTIGVTLSSTVSTVPEFIKLMNRAQYLEFRAELFNNSGISPTNRNNPDHNEFNGLWDQNRETDWQKVLAGNSAIRRNAQISISGGSERTQFLFSSALVNETTVFPGDFNYNRLSFQSNINHKSKDNRFSFNLSTNYGIDDNDRPADGLYLAALQLSPVAPALYDEDGNLNWQRVNGISTFRNPIASIEKIFQSETKNLVANASISYKITDNLEIKTNLGYTDVRFEEFQANPRTRTSDPLLFGGVSDRSRFSELLINNSDRTSWIAEPQINYNFSAGKLKIQFLTGATFQSRYSRTDTETRTGFATDRLILDRSAAFTVTPGFFFEEIDRISSIYSRLNFNYQGKYILNLTGRRDGSTRFGKNNRFGNFGAIGAAWVFSKESLIRDKQSIISFGKIRASYGLTGSDNISTNQYAPFYVSGGLNNTYNNIAGTQLRNIGNPDLQWETNTKLEVAIDIGLFNDNIFLTAAWYRNRSGNQLVSIPQPINTGFARFPANLEGALVENTGLEIGLRTVNINTKKFKWTTNFNFTRARNELVRFDDLAISPFRDILTVGQPLSSQRAYKFIEVNPTTGEYIFEDSNNDGRINSRDVVAGNTFVDFSPDFFGGVTNNITYKNWQLNFLLQYSKQEGPSFYGLRTGAMARPLNLPVEFLNRWRQPGNTNTSVQRLDTEFDLLNTAITLSDENVEDASFVRLRTASLTYNLPKDVLKDVRASFFIQGQNLFVISNYFAPDPEIGPGSLPSLRQISLGVNLTF
ncbi:SusC/RagA family TonB-linked outer membrane protein [Flavivirga abyssicola]|uniref:SusC/RagA family TonB-linked outer membrane protein n=1 Tax=Flavivirga abyssicola TaxID=3063533 RepID=UPI0026DFA557|nr:SusC/RagA family TonB-linked outer membrane protein [Flavivirga sp. MEBiC07777]WVK12016.1 SusC/RagA family TonB-linked outer membrane protein [Flavivirga sp. MEBiC07777]